MIVRVPNHIIDTLISILILAILPVVLINYKILKNERLAFRNNPHIENEYHKCSQPVCRDTDY